MKSTIASPALSRRAGSHHLLKLCALVGGLAFTGQVLGQAPTITLQPTNTHAAVGNTVSFAVSAMGGGTLSYRWYLDGTLLSDGGRFTGTRTNVLTLISVRTNDAGNYSVIVSNASGTTPSQPAALIVHDFSQPPAGAVARWAAEGNANDSVDGNHGAAFGVAYAPGWVGQAFQFESQAGDHIWLPPSAVVDLSRMNNWTITAWIRPTGSNWSATPTIYAKDGGSPSLGVDIFSWKLSAWMGGPDSLASDGTVPTNVWTHAALVHSGTNCAFYLNGANSGSAAAPRLTPISAGAFIGASSAGGGYFDGRIDELTIYNRALSDAEVQQVCRPGSSNLPPLILQQPAGQAVYAGDNAALSVGAVGTAPLTYRWHLAGTNLADSGRIAGSHTPSLSITSVQPGDAGNYSVSITNVEGWATSQVATLTVAVRPPVITLLPQSLTLTHGNTASFTVAATSAVPMTCQWRFNGTNLANGGQFSGVTTTNLTIANVIPTNAGAYSVTVTNSGGATNSPAATLTVKTFPPVIVAQTGGGPVGAGATVNFSVTATGQPPLSYQWRFNGTNLANGGQFSGVTTSNLTVASVQPVNSGGYSVAITNVYGAVTSSPASLTVTPGPAIIQQPIGQTASVGDTVTFTAQASGSPAPTYQWRFNAQPILHATNNILTLTHVGLANVGFYDVVVSNATGFATSTAVSLGFVDLKMFAGVIITGPTGATYRVDYTPALANPPAWQPLDTVTLPTSPYYFIDYASPGVEKRFYRAVPQP